MAETIPTRVYILERDLARIDRETFGDNGLEVRIDKVESRLDVMGAKLAVYATLGAVLGGGFASGIAALLLK